MSVIRLRARFGAMLAAICVAVAIPAGASAQDSEPAVNSAARQIGFEGVQAYEAGHYQEALEKLQRAYELVKVPTFGLWSARSLVKLNRLVLASERYLEVTRIELDADARDVQRKAQDDARNERAALLPRIPSVVINVSGSAAASAQVSLDGKPVASGLLGAKVPVDPGAHHVEARVGDRVEKRDVTLAEGASETVTIDVGAAPPVPPRVEVSKPASPAPDRPAPFGPPPSVAIAALGVGAVGLLAGGITGALTLEKHADLESSPDCRNGACLPPAHGDVDALNTLRVVSTVGFILGGAGVATGVTLLVIRGGRARTGASAPRSALTLAASPGVAALRGAY